MLWRVRSSRGRPTASEKWVVGGLRAATIRALLYAGMNRALVRRIREAHGDMGIADFNALVREQFNILLIDQEAALAAIPSMLPHDVEIREKAYELFDQLLSARGELTAEEKNEWTKLRGCLALGAARRHAFAELQRNCRPKHPDTIAIGRRH